MNGYELADEIKTMLADAESYYGEAESYLIKCETMLRQQQAEIEALKAKLNKYHLKEDLDRNLDLIYGKEFIK